jgi:hypothetical protein
VDRNRNLAELAIFAPGHEKYVETLTQYVPFVEYRIERHGRFTVLTLNSLIPVVAPPYRNQDQPESNMPAILTACGT